LRELKKRESYNKVMIIKRELIWFSSHLGSIFVCENVFIFEQLEMKSNENANLTKEFRRFVQYTHKPENNASN